MSKINQGWIYRDQIQAKDAGKTILDYYSQRYTHSSREQWRERILLGQITLEEQPITPDTPLQPGQTLAYHRPPWSEPDVPLNFKIIYQDQDLWLINKPSGLPVMPGGGFVHHTLLWQLKKQYPSENLIPIHRLGRGTSGLMFIARSLVARQGLSQQMRQRKIEKIYLAWVQGAHFPAHILIDQKIGRLLHPLLGYLYGASDQGLASLSEAWVIGRTSTATLVAIKITTGRPHQIRIHLAAIGYPLVNDPLYEVGGKPRIPKDTENSPLPGDEGYFLHAYQVSWLDLQTHQLRYEGCPPPHSFWSLI